MRIQTFDGSKNENKNFFFKTSDDRSIVLRIKKEKGRGIQTSIQV